MGSSAKNDYCAFTKAVEYLGDRWSLLIVREIAMFGPQGFNTLAQGLPGHVSRSVLAEKLRKLEELGIIARTPAAGPRPGPYQLTPAGMQLQPVMRGLWGWAERWVPEDPAVAQRDPDIVTWWLANRVDGNAVLEREVVIDLSLLGPRGPLHAWLVLRRGAEPQVCVEDPLLAEERYVYVEATTDALNPIARGIQRWDDAIANRSVQVFGDPALIGAMSDWFLDTAHPMRSGSPAAPLPAVARQLPVLAEA
jgi:DNA-binding HxlR family transcriptional regulator